MDFLKRSWRWFYGELRFEIPHFLSSRFVLVYFPVALAGTALLRRLYVDHVSGPDENPFFRFAVVAGTMFLVFGWIVAAEIAVRNSKTQHTLGLITQYLAGSEHVKVHETLRTKIRPVGANLSPRHGNFDGNSEIIRAVKRELSFLEYMCAAYRRHTIDQRLFERCMRTVIRSHYERTEDFIEFSRKNYPDVCRDLTVVYRKFTMSLNPLDDLPTVIVGGIILTGVLWVGVKVYLS